MTERGILFNQEMVRAILDGRKTQTRRIVKPQPYKDDFKAPVKEGLVWVFRSDHRHPYRTRPRYQVGDRLYVRETWSDPYGEKEFIYYRADCERTHTDEGDKIKWRSSMHMPKELARIWLEITGVRVERVRDISYEDCGSEGIEIESAIPSLCGRKSESYGRFKTLWQSCYPGSWERNDWVWVYEFKKKEKNNPSKVVR